MKYLLDTCLLSELIKPNPNSGVIDWITAQNEEHLYISALTLGEIVRGIEKLPKSGRRSRLQAWVDKDLRNRFEGRILSVDEEIAEAWGSLTAKAEAKGKSIPAIDGLISATAISNGLTVCTRNTKDIEPTGAGCINPWK